MKTSNNKAVAVILFVSMISTLAACSSQQMRSTLSTTDSLSAEAVQSTSVAVSTTSATSVPTETTAASAITSSASKTATATVSVPAAATAPAAPATTAEPAWKETKLSAEMYLNTSVYSRTKAYLGAPTADLYQINDKVKVVAVTDTDYYKLSDGKFIHRDYLSEAKTVIQTTTATTAPPMTTVPITATVKPVNKKPAAVSGKYISSGYSALDEKIQPVLDSIVTKNMSNKQKLKAVYDYLMQFSYTERTLLIPQAQKEYSEQLYACFILDNGYGVCYDFTSAFKYMAQALGFDVRMIYGYHTNPSGGAGEHSWAEIDIDGMTYIFDPAIEKILINEGFAGSSRFMRTYDEIGKYYIFS